MIGHRKLVGRVLLVALLSVVFPLDQLDAQSRLLTWLRERVGDRAAKDENQASLDTQWQQETFQNEQAQQRFIAAIKKSRCNTCHVKGQKKDVCNAFGTALSTLLRAELQMDTEELTAALKLSAPQEIREQAQAAFYQALDDSLSLHVDLDNESSATFGQRIKQGDLPAAMESTNDAK